MGDENARDAQSDLGAVPVTIELLHGPGRRSRTRLRHARVMPGVAFAAPIAVAAAIAIVVASSGSVPIRAADALAARFGIRLPCARLTMISADGNYARVDFDRFRPCGTYGNYGTIVLRRVHRHWIREFEASGQTCRMSLVAPLVLVELKLCSPAIAQPPPGS